MMRVVLELYLMLWTLALQVFYIVGPRGLFRFMSFVALNDNFLFKKWNYMICEMFCCTNKNVID